MKNSHRSRLLLAGAFFLLLTALLIVLLSSSALAGSTLYGKVTDAETGNPIEEAEVYLTGEENEYRTITDRNGEYSLDCNSGKYDLKITADGYKSHSDTITLEEGEEKEYNAKLEKEEEENSKIYGTVTDKETEDPISEARVRIYNKNKDYYATTNDEGYYEVTCYSGHYTIEIMKSGYRTYNGEEDVGEEEEVEHNAALEPKGEENSRVYGTISDNETGDGIEGADVLLKSSEDSYKVQTDEGGDYSITCYSGDYDVEVHAEGYQSHYGEVSVEENDEVRYDANLEKEAGEDSKVYGKVTDKDTGDPLGANVKLDGEKKSYKTFTDRSGNYEIQCYADEYRVTVESDGYKTHYGEVKVGEGEEVRYDVQLEREDPPDSKVYGNVTDAETEEPIEDAYVKMSNSENSYATWTDEGGYYEIECHSGDYDITVSKDGYKDHRDQITVKSGEEKEYNVALEPEGPANSKVYGTVTDAETEEPISEASVYLRNSEHSYSTRTDKEGYYEIECHSGDYEITITKEGYKDHKGEVSVEENEEVRYDAKLERDAGETYLEGYITEGSGRGEGDPVVEATVKLTSSNREYAGSTDEDGYYYIRCEEDEYSIEVTHEDYEKHEDDITIKAGANRYDAELTPKAMGKIHGIVTDKETEEPLDGAKVRLRDKDSGKDHETYTDKEGYYFLEVPAGDYSILVQQTDYVNAEDEVTIEKDDDIERDYQLEKEIREGEVWGDVKDDAANKGIGGVLLTFEEQDSRGDESYTATTEGDGYYEIDLPEGNYNVTVEHDDYKTIHSTVKVVGEGSVEKNYRMDPKEGEIYGEVTDTETSDPIEGATITAEEKEGRGGESYTNSTTTDRDGEYSMHLPPGEYTITIEHDEYIKLWDNITIEKEDEQKLDYQLEIRTKEGTVYGTITDEETSEPMKGVLVSLDTDSGRGEPSSGSTQMITTDEEGYYEFSASPGDYFLTVEEDGYVTIEDTVTLEHRKSIEKSYAMERVPDKGFVIETDAPSSIEAGEVVNIIITVSEESRGAGVADAELTLSIEGPGSLNRLVGTTNSEGQFTVRLSVEDVELEDEITINITAEKEDYQTTSYEETITVTPPEPDIVGPEEGEFDNGASYAITSGIIGDGELDIYATTSPDPEDASNMGIFLDITFDDDGGDSELAWVYIIINYDEVPRGLNENNLKVYYWDEDTEEWVEAEVTGVDTVNNFVWANVTHLTTFAPRDETGEALKNYGVELTGEQERTVAAGELVEYFLSIENTGEETDSYTIEISGAKEEWGSLSLEDVSLDEGDYETFTVTVTVPGEVPAGSYTLKIKATSEADPGVEDEITLRVTVESEGDGEGDSPGFPLWLGILSLATIAILRKRR